MLKYIIIIYVLCVGLGAAQLPSLFNIQWQINTHRNQSMIKLIPNEYCHIDNGITEIIIKSNIYGIKKCLIDTLDFNLVHNFRWYLSKKNKKRFDILSQRNKKKIYIHRLIMNCPEGMDVDHINHEPSDNRKCNLRICTHQENTYNNISNKGSSRFIGVSYKKELGKWRSYAFKDYKQINLGLFESEIEAAKVRDKAAKELFGEFANLNFI